MPTDTDEAAERLRVWTELIRGDDFRTAMDVRALLVEREALLAWKADALAVLARWDRVAALVPDMPLGSVVSDATYEYVKALQARIAAAIVQHPRMDAYNAGWASEGWPDICGLCRTTWPCPTVHAPRGE